MNNVIVIGGLSLFSIVIVAIVLVLTKRRNNSNVNEAQIKSSEDTEEQVEETSDPADNRRFMELPLSVSRSSMAPSVLDDYSSSDSDSNSSGSDYNNSDGSQDSLGSDGSERW